jgi:hypothetical protein
MRPRAEGTYVRWRDQQLIVLAVGFAGVALVLSDGVDLLGISLAILMAGIGLRGARSGAVATQEYLIVRNLFSTHRLPWSLIDRFEVTRFKLVDRPVAAVRLVDGSFCRIGHFCALSPTGPALRRLTGAVRDLEAARPA